MKASGHSKNGGHPESRPSKNAQPRNAMKKYLIRGAHNAEGTTGLVQEGGAGRAHSLYSEAMKNVFFVLLLLSANLFARHRPDLTEGNPSPAHGTEKTSENFSNQVADKDLDGIDDGLETWLLARYRPYFKFSSGESIYPIDAAVFVSQCELKFCGNPPNGDCDKNAGTVLSTLTQANALLGSETKLNVTKSPAKSAYHLSPRVGHDALGRYYPLPCPTKQQEKTAGNIGLYGHVVPIKLPNPYYYDLQHVPSGSDGPNTYYKVEYWMFCSYNDANGAGIANHEADWMTVQLIVDHAGNDWRIGTVLFYAHGHEMQFQMNQVLQGPNGSDSPTGDQGEKFLRYKGPNFGKSVDIWPISHTYSATLQNNQVRFYPDPETGEPTHPVVYPEKGSHEFWPTDEWYIHSPTDANGRGLSYLSTTIPNLGEVEHPLQEYPLANFILQYNGYWGCWSRKNSPPPGPTVHTEWTYPATSAIRWQLTGLEN